MADIERHKVGMHVKDQQPCCFQPPTLRVTLDLNGIGSCTTNSFFGKACDSGEVKSDKPDWKNADDISV